MGENQRDEPPHRTDLRSEHPDQSEQQWERGRQAPEQAGQVWPERGKRSDLKPAAEPPGEQQQTGFAAERQAEKGPPGELFTWRARGTPRRED
jgi:hypothetical protein